MTCDARPGNSGPASSHQEAHTSAGRGPGLTGGRARRTNRHARRLPIPAAWPARSNRTVREWAIVSAGLAPVLLTGAYLVADILQRASYSPMRQTMSAMAGQAGTDRWIMTGGIFLVAGCYLVTAPGLTGVRASARVLLTDAGGPSVAGPAAAAGAGAFGRLRLRRRDRGVRRPARLARHRAPRRRLAGPGGAVAVIGPDLVAVRRRRGSAPRPHHRPAGPA